MPKPEVKALFFDVDGTLSGYQAHRINPRDLESLSRLQEKGYLLFIATGRDLTLQKEHKAIEPVVPYMTGFISSNGQYCYLKDGTDVSKHPIHEEDFVSIRDMCAKKHFGILYGISGESYTTEMTDNVAAFAEFVGIAPPDVRPFTPDNHTLLKLCVYVSAEDQKKYLDPLIRHSWTARTSDFLTDIIPDGIGKDSGLREICAHFGIDPAQTMAFGDGANDIPILKAAGIGVAMGIAPDAVKASADYITTSSEEAGITQALEHFGLL